jgi:hypothetical protein
VDETQVLHRAGDPLARDGVDSTARELITVFLTVVFAARVGISLSIGLNRRSRKATTLQAAE